MSDTLFLRALNGERTPRPPFWFMRQAGRCLPEYRALRKQHTFEELLKEPQLGADVTMMPIERFGMDAAILFTDLLVTLEAMGPGAQLHARPRAVVDRRWPWRSGAPGRGRLRDPRELPRAARVRARDAAAAVRGPHADRLRRCALHARLLPDRGQGFQELGQAAAHAVRGARVLPGDAGSPRADLARLRAGPGAARAAMRSRSSTPGPASPSRGASGAWCCLRCRSSSAACVRTACPVIYFVNGAQPHLDTMLETGASCLGIDWRMDIADAHARMPEGMPVQGNLDPLVLHATPEAIRSEASRIVERRGLSPPHLQSRARARADDSARRPRDAGRDPLLARRLNPSLLAEASP